MNAEHHTIAAGPVVIVTDGPIVPRSVYVVDIVVCDVEIAAVSSGRSAMLLAPVVTKIRPAVVAFAGAVSARLSRMCVLNCAAVNTVFATAVIGAVQAIWTAPSLTVL